MEIAQGFAEFVAIVEQGSVSAAARHLDEPRPSVSRRLARLEARLGQRLLHRSTRRLVLTPAGEELYRRARQVVDQARAAEEALLRLDQVPRGTLRVSTPPTQDPVLAELFVAFRRRYPEVRLEVLATTRYVDLVAEGFDLALRAGRSPGDPSLFQRRLLRSRMLVWGSPGYLQARGRPQKLADLAQHNCLLGFDSSQRPHRSWPLLDGGQVQVHGSLASNQLELLTEAARQGEGLAMLPELFTYEDRRAGRLEAVLPEVLGLVTGMDLVYAERAYQEPRVRAFIDMAAPWIAERWGALGSSS